MCSILTLNAEDRKAYPQMDMHISGLTNGIDFSDAILLLQGKGIIINAEMPFVVPSTPLQLTGSDLPLQKLLDQISAAYGYKYREMGSTIIVYDPQLQPFDKVYPLNQIVSDFTADNIPYDIAIKNLSSQMGIRLIALTTDRFVKKTTIKIHNSTLRDLFESIRADIHSKGWYCSVAKKNNKFVVIVTFM